jgi:hypothetical protein
MESREPGNALRIMRAFNLYRSSMSFHLNKIKKVFYPFVYKVGLHAKKVSVKEQNKALFT